MKRLFLITVLLVVSAMAFAECESVPVYNASSGKFLVPEVLVIESDEGDFWLRKVLFTSNEDFGFDVTSYNLVFCEFSPADPLCGEFMPVEDLPEEIFEEAE